MGTSSSGINAFSAGEGSVAGGTAAVALGYYATAGNGGSFAAGYHTTAGGYYAGATGYYTTADAQNDFVIGRYNVGGGTFNSWVATDPLFEIGIGSSSLAKANALTVLKNGNVGIGTTSPEMTLSLGDGSANDGAILAKGYGTVGTNGQTLSVSGAGTRMVWYPKKAAFRAGATTGTSWDDGNIGLYSMALGRDTIASGPGSTAFGEGANASGSRSTALGYYSYADGTYSFSAGQSVTADSYAQVTIGKNNMPTGSENATSWVTTDPLFVVGNGTGSGGLRSNAMMILKNGNVGIGTTTPPVPLDIKGDSRVFQDGSSSFSISSAGGGSSANPYLFFTASRGTHAAPTFPLDGDSLGAITFQNYFGNWGAAINVVAVGNHQIGPGRTGAKIEFATSPSTSNSITTRMVISDAGNVGIGTSSPDSKLQVDGHVWPETTATSNLGSSSLRWNNIYLSNAPDVSSDARLKKDVKDSDLGLEFINSLRPVSWIWKDANQGSTSHYGVIAQETERAVRKAKGYNSSNVIVSHNEENDSYSVRYTELISPLIKAIQELYSEFKRVKNLNEVYARQAEIKIQRLEFENAAKTKELEDMKARLEKIEEMINSK